MKAYISFGVKIEVFEKVLDLNRKIISERGGFFSFLIEKVMHIKIKIVESYKKRFLVIFRL